MYSSYACPSCPPGYALIKSTDIKCGAGPFNVGVICVPSNEVPVTTYTPPHQHYETIFMRMRSAWNSMIEKKLKFKQTKPPKRYGYFNEMFDDATYTDLFSAGNVSYPCPVDYPCCLGNPGAYPQCCKFDSTGKCDTNNCVVI